ncbi:MAG: 2Fe-2S iron-sulfur cluster-binding protein [Myxococcota bacterium]
MNTVKFEGRTLQVPSGTRLRDALLKEGLTPHNGPARALNCHGFATCGTCAVRIEGEVAPPSARERARLSFPPHSAESGLRLACQVRVEHDLEVQKFEGFWGQDTAKARASR